MMEEVAERLKVFWEGVKLSKVKMIKVVDIKWSSLNHNGFSKDLLTFEALTWYVDFFDVSKDYIFWCINNLQVSCMSINRKSSRATFKSSSLWRCAWNSALPRTHGSRRHCWKPLRGWRVNERYDILSWIWN